ncbi:MAG: hypothetical protein U0793_29425 [Gemmataceae bacterium]
MSESIRPAPEHPEERLPPPLPRSASFLDETDEPAPRAEPLLSLAGQTAREQRGAPIFGWILISIVPLFVVASIVSKQSAWAVFTAFPLCTGAALVLTRRRPLEVRFDVHDLELNRGPGRLRYDEIAGVYGSGGDKRFNIHLRYRGGFLTIPAAMDFPSATLFEWLRSVCPEDKTSRVPEDLRFFFESQRKIFGAREVRVFCPRPVGAGPTSRGFVFFLGGVAAGLVWLVVGGALRSQPWMGIGGATMLLSALFGLLFWLSGRHSNIPAKDRERSCLIVTPGGLAMIQGPLKGELRWSEVVDLKPAKKTLDIKVAGARIQVFDIYDEALASIHEAMQRFWLEGNIRR